MESRSIESPQHSTHSDLKKTIQRHLQSPWRKPIGEPTQKSWDRFLASFVYEGQEIILDSGVGVGESSIQLAGANPNSIIIAHDRSVERLQTFGVHRYRHEQEFGKLNNLYVLRADSADLWRLLLTTNWNFVKHYILYPNPYPKTSQLKRRWHGHPIFPDLLRLCPNIEIRSNWKLYLDEFAEACQLIGEHSSSLVELTSIEKAMTHFEAKYFSSEQSLWKLNVL